MDSFHKQTAPAQYSTSVTNHKHGEKAVKQQLRKKQKRPLMWNWRGAEQKDSWGEEMRKKTTAERNESNK